MVNVYKNLQVLFLVTWLFILFAQETEGFIFTMFMFIKILEKIMCKTFESGSFLGQGHYII